MSRLPTSSLAVSLMAALCMSTPADQIRVPLEGPAGHPAMNADVAASLESGTEAVWSDNTPGPWIYDPSTQTSRVNRTSLQCGPQTRLRLTLPADEDSQSLTLECFLKADEIPRASLRLLSHSTANADIAFGLKRLHNFNQTYWGGFARQQQQRLSWTAGHYITAARLRGDALDWHHVAVVYDHQRQTVSTYLDHWLCKTETLDAPISWQAGEVLLGHHPGSPPFVGQIDELRITRAALRPADFLRAVTEPLQNVNFRSPPTVLPEASGYIDVREGFGAVGDGIHDDTDAFQRAFRHLANQHVAHFRTLYLPPGEYRVSRRLHCNRFVNVQGSGRDRTVIRLLDEAPDFADTSQPEPVIRASSTRTAPGTNRQVNGSSIGIYFADLTINTGRGNPGATGLEYHSNNHGSLERVRIVSEDRQGAVALDLSHKTNGPALVRDVELLGFDVGILIKHAEYSMTLEHIHMADQRTAAIINQSNILAVRGLTSDNSVPAILSQGGGSMITLLDSQLNGGDPATTAMEAEGGFYGRNIKVSGYGTTLRKRVMQWHGWKEKPPLSWQEDETISGNIDEWWGDVSTTPFAAQAGGSLKLPIEETPDPVTLTPEQWAVVNDYQNLVTEGDWTAAIQAAVDSGQPGLVLPVGRYRVDGTIWLRGNLQRIHGMKGTLSRGQGMETEKPLLQLAWESPEHVLVIEHLDIAGRLHHDSPATLSLQHSNPQTYTTAAGVGRLFLEGVQSQGWKFSHPQQIWCRQWNPEAHGAGPVIESHGATVWSLGFKTEYESSKLWAFDGARTEILGGFIYPVKKGIPPDRPVFRHVDSDFTGIWGMSVYVANHKLQVEDTRGATTIRTTTDDGGSWAKSRYRMDLYSNLPAKTATRPAGSTQP